MPRFWPFWALWAPWMGPRGTQNLHFCSQLVCPHHMTVTERKIQYSFDIREQKISWFRAFLAISTILGPFYSPWRAPKGHHLQFFLFFIFYFNISTKRDQSEVFWSIRLEKRPTQDFPLDGSWIVYYVGQGPPNLHLRWCPCYGGRGLVRKWFSLHTSYLQRRYPSLGSRYSFIGGGGEYKVFHAKGTIMIE